jgi:hypothetical protein
MAFDTTKETMVSFLVSLQILQTIDDIRVFEGTLQDHPLSEDYLTRD